MGLPLISVLMTTLNSEQFISEAIESVLLQTLTNFELLIIDGGSTDKTLEIVRFVNDPRINLHVCPGLRRGAQLNYGVSQAKADIIAIMDSDDIALPTRFKRQYEALTADKSISIIGSWAYLVNESKQVLGVLRRPVQHKKIAHHLFSMNGICMGTTCWKKNLFESSTCFNEQLRFEDLDWMAKIEPIARFANISEPLMMLRQRQNSRSRTASEHDRSSLFRSVYDTFQNQLSTAQTRIRRSDIHRNLGICSYYYGDKKTSIRYLLESFVGYPFCLLTIQYLFVELFFSSNLLKRLRTTIVFRKIGSSLRYITVIVSIMSSKDRR